ncbi:MAG: hypothetical protein VYA34_01530 [Myxococcota bacterium]|nr:hypothetical protein [Myxococcota bacterium]
MELTTIISMLQRIEERLDALDDKLESMKGNTKKSMEWIGTLSEHVRSLDEFREEVRATFEPMAQKMDNVDEVTRILRHATVDISRRVEKIQRREDRGDLADVMEN